MLLANSPQIREADRIQIQEHKFPGILLMEEAGRLAAKRIWERYPKGRNFLVLTGPGNNGGDGLVIARYLHLWGQRVEVLLSHAPDRYAGDAKINYDIFAELPISCVQWSDYRDQQRVPDSDCIYIDALLGTGISKQLRGSVAEMIAFFSTHPRETIAIDLPSGLDASSGSLLNAPLPATLTLTFQLPKVCHHVYPAASQCGAVEVLDIGIWPAVLARLGIEREVLDEKFVHRHMKKRNANTHKGSFGHVLAIGGSHRYAGAIAMAGFGAMKAGAGLSSVFAPEVCRTACQSLCPELMFVSSEHPEYLTEKDSEQVLALLENKDALLIGPGMGMHEQSQALLAKILPHIHIPVIWDADGLNVLSRNPDLLTHLPSPSILTPHPGEMRRLISAISSPEEDMEVSTHRLELTEYMASKLSAVLVLKGAGSIIANPEGKTYVNPTGNAGMATAGSGDVLAGIILALLGQGYEATLAAALSAYLHGKAGDTAAAQLGQASMLATDIARALRIPT